jgi:hypothetical protein
VLDSFLAGSLQEGAARHVRPRSPELRRDRQEVSAAMFDAELHALLDDRERAIAAIARADAAGCSDAGWLTACPLIAPLRWQPSAEAPFASIAARSAAVAAVLAPLR